MRPWRWSLLGLEMMRGASHPQSVVTELSSVDDVPDLKLFVPLLALCFAAESCASESQHLKGGNSSIDGRLTVIFLS